MYAKALKNQSGYFMIQALIACTVLLATLVFVLSGSSKLQQQTLTQVLKTDLANIMNAKLSVMSGTISKFGMTHFLETYATTSGLVNQLTDPVINQDPNSVFSTAFVGGNSTETLNVDGRDFAVSYTLRIYRGVIDSSTGSLTPTEVNFPNSTIRLSQVALLRLVATAQDVDTGTIRVDRELDYAYHY